MNLKISQIKIGKRHRKDLGDISALAASIGRIGLIHDVVITPEHKLISGARRIAAFKVLKRDSISVKIARNIKDAADLLIAERDENTERKDLTRSEAVAIGRSLEELESKAAKTRQREHGNTAPGRKKITPGKLPEVIGDTRDQVGRAVGMSGRTYEKAKAVVESGQQDLIEQMDKSGNVDRAYKEMNRREKSQSTTNAQTRITKQEFESVCDIRHCSMIELLKSVKPDCIITDPPYSKQAIPLYEDLAKSAKHIQLIAVMCGQSYLPQILNAMCKHLSYRWVIAYLTPGGQSVQQWEAKVNVFWKPVLLFGNSASWIGDVSKSAPNDNDKRFHEWGQSESGMLDLIERLTKPGQLICDPFMGAGTTAIAALRLGRRFVGCDKDKSSVAKTKKRCEATLECMKEIQTA